MACVLGCFTILKPVHIDEANFLMLTRGDFLSPHHTLVNWQGKTERAFDVLSNPAGIAWILWPFKNLDPMWMRLTMIPWIVVFLYGVEKLGAFFLAQKWFLVLLTLFSPVVFLYNGALMPDIPLVAMYILGLAGVCTTQHYKWAFIAGCSALFRYSGLTVIPLIFAWGIIFGYKKKALWLSLVACIPFGILTIHDFTVYGESHFFHMISFQASEQTPIYLKMAAFFSMLSGAVVFPSFSSNRKSLTLLAIGLGIGLGLIGYMNTVMDVFWFGFGLFLFMNTVCFTSKKDIALSIWILGGVFFLSQLRFAATRYWLPFFLPVLIISLRDAKFWKNITLLILTSILSIFLSLDDFLFSVAHKEAAQQIASLPEKGMFAGHWGWQHYLEEDSWKSVEDDVKLRSDIWFATINTAWPQEVEGCLLLKQEFFSSSFWGPRVHTYEGKANFHSSHLAGGGMVFSPWSFGNDSYVHMKLFRTCP